MSGLQQPLRASPTPLGWGRRHRKAKQLTKRPVVISEPRSLGRCPFDPSPLPGSATPEAQRAMHPAEVVYGANQPHPCLQGRPLTRRRPRPAHQRSQPGAKGGLKSLDVGGVDDRGGGALGRPQPGSHFSFRTAHDAPNHPGYPSPSVALDRLGYHEAFRQKKPRTTSLAGANRRAKHLERLLRVSCQPISAKQKDIESAAGAHTFEERTN